MLIDSWLIHLSAGILPSCCPILRSTLSFERLTFLERRGPYGNPAPGRAQRTLGKKGGLGEVGTWEIWTGGLPNVTRSHKTKLPNVRNELLPKRAEQSFPFPLAHRPVLAFRVVVPMRAVPSQKAQAQKDKRTKMTIAVPPKGDPKRGIRRKTHLKVTRSLLSHLNMFVLS